MCSYNIPQRDATPRTPLGELTALPQTSGLDFGDRRERDRKGKGKERAMGKKWKGKKGKGGIKGVGDKEKVEGWRKGKGKGGNFVQL